MKIEFTINNRNLGIFVAFFLALLFTGYVMAQSGTQSHPWSQISCSSCITSGNIANNAVTSAKIADNSITSVDIVDNSILDTDIAADAVKSSEIAANAVGSSEILDASITNADISSSASISPSKIAAGDFASGNYRFPGNLGIGISPAYKLDVAGDLRVGSSGFLLLQAGNKWLRK